MLSPEIIQTIQTLSRADKIKLLQIVITELDADEKKLERAQKFEAATKRAFSEYREAFEQLAKGVE